MQRMRVSLGVGGHTGVGNTFMTMHEKNWKWNLFHIKQSLQHEFACRSII